MRNQTRRSPSNPGRFNSTTDYTVTVDPQDYDARNRVTSTTWTIDGAAYTVDWTYDAADRVTSIRYPTVGNGRETVDYAYDDTSRGLPSGLVSDKPSADTPLVSAVSWNELGAPLAQTWGSGDNAVSRVWSYEVDTLRLDKLEAVVGAGPNKSQNLAFNYFDDGNVKDLTDFRNTSQKQCFEYDDLSRLTVAYTLAGTCSGVADWDNSLGTGPYRRQYDYLNNGNLDRVATAGGSWDDYTYAETGNAGPHAVTDYLGWDYEYDENGNMETRTNGVQDDDLTFDWNNRLAKYVADDGTAVTTWLVYDADGTRVARIETGGDTTHYVGGIFEITNPTGSSTSRSYYSFNGQTIGYRYRVTGSGERRFLLTDHLGTNSVEVNETSGAVTEQYYLPYGDLRGSTSNGLGTDRTYTGQTTDESTGLMFYNARYYLPAVRRFISADTIVPDPGNPQDLNRYTYVGNNPTNLIDPTGHRPEECAGFGWLTNFLTCLWDWEKEEIEENSEPIRPVIGGAVKVVTGLLGDAEFYVSVVDAAARGDLDPLISAVGALPAGAVQAGSYFGDVLQRAIDGDPEALGELSASSIIIVGGIPFLREKGGGSVRIQRYDGPKPAYHVNPAHVPGNRGWGRDKTPLPADAGSVYRSAIPDDPVNPRHWYGLNVDGEVYRFSDSNNGTAHFSAREDYGDGIRDISPYAKERLTLLGWKSG